MFIGQHDTVYRRKPFSKSTDLTDGTPRKRLVEPSVIIDDKILAFRLRFFTSPHGPCRHEWKTNGLAGNLFAAWRLMYLVEKMPLLSEERLKRIVIVTTCSKEFHKIPLEELHAEFGRAPYDAIMTAVPSQYGNALTMLAQRGVAFDKETVVDELRAGRMLYTEGLRTAGIEPLETYDARKREEDLRVAELEPFFNLAVSRCEPPTDKESAEYLLRSLLRTGVEDRIVLIAAATGIGSHSGILGTEPSRECDKEIRIDFRRTIHPVVTALAEAMPDELCGRDIATLVEDTCELASKAESRPEVYEIY